MLALPYLMGYVTGDGYTRFREGRCSEITLYGQESDWARVRTCLDLLGVAGNKRAVKETVWALTIPKDSQNLFLEKGLYLEQRARTKTLPKGWENWFKEEAEWFLNGLLDADGGAYCYWGTQGKRPIMSVVLITASEKLAGGVRMLLSGLGAEARCRKQNDESYRVSLTYAGIKAILPWLSLQTKKQERVDVIRSWFEYVV